MNYSNWRYSKQQKCPDGWFSLARSHIWHCTSYGMLIRYSHCYQCLYLSNLKLMRYSHTRIKVPTYSYIIKNLRFYKIITMLWCIKQKPFVIKVHTSIQYWLWEWIFQSVTQINHLQKIIINSDVKHFVKVWLSKLLTWELIKFDKSSHQNFDETNRITTEHKINVKNKVCLSHWLV